MTWLDWFDGGVLCLVLLFIGSCCLCELVLMLDGVLFVVGLEGGLGECDVVVLFVCGF